MAAIEARLSAAEFIPVEEITNLCQAAISPERRVEIDLALWLTAWSDIGIAVAVRMASIPRIWIEWP